MNTKVKEYINDTKSYVIKEIYNATKDNKITKDDVGTIFDKTFKIIGTIIDDVEKRGPQGTRGPQGHIGIQGMQGPQGVTGNIGLSIQGPQGEIGRQGAQGIIGSQGERGVIGDKGNIGFAIQGPQGNIGEQGYQGDIGSVGTRGAKGSKGTLGICIQGAQGFIGEQGPQGIQGVQGDYGKIGDKGPKGESFIGGPQGETGPQGSHGAQGVVGENGENGKILGNMIEYPIKNDSVVDWVYLSNIPEKQYNKLYNTSQYVFAKKIQIAIPEIESINQIRKSRLDNKKHEIDCFYTKCNKGLYIYWDDESEYTYNIDNIHWYYNNNGEDDINNIYELIGICKINSYNNNDGDKWENPLMFLNDGSLPQVKNDSYTTDVEIKISVSNNEIKHSNVFMMNKHGYCYFETNDSTIEPHGNEF